MKSPKLLASAKGQPCTFRIPTICNFDPQTTVACHGPDKLRGKAMKTLDLWIAYGCSNCHKALDERQIPEWEEYWLQGILETQKRLVEAGLIIVPVTTPKPKKMTKQVERRRLYG